MLSMKLAGVDLNLLLPFVALAEERSVTRAARRVGIGQPAMSAALRRLRDLFDDDLFVRVDGVMKPTAKALQLQPALLESLKAIDQTLHADAAFHPAAARRSFTIASSDHAAAVVLPPLLRVLRKRAPGIDLRVVNLEKNLIGEMLDRGEIDLGLGVFLRAPRRGMAKELFHDRFVGLARKRHPRVRRGAMSLADFVQLPQALMTNARDAVGCADEQLAARNLKRRVAVTIPHLLILPFLIGSSDLICGYPKRLERAAKRLAPLQTFALPLPMAEFAVSMVWSKAARNDPQLAFLRNAIEESVRRGD
jgi:DNA-binding transcriptional LysR family regulator